MYKVKGGFACDRQSKYDFTASTINYLIQAMGDKLKSVEFYEYDENDNLIEFDSKNVDGQSRTDLAFFVNGNKRVNAELKERWGKYNSNCYGKDEDKEGWILEMDKKEKLMEKIGLPLYANLYMDGKIRLWNLNKIENFNIINKNTPKTTVIQSEIINKDRYEVWNRDSKVIQRIIGSKSNGVWKSKGLN